LSNESKRKEYDQILTEYDIIGARTTNINNINSYNKNYNYQNNKHSSFYYDKGSKNSKWSPYNDSFYVFRDPNTGRIHKIKIQNTFYNIDNKNKDFNFYYEEELRTKKRFYYDDYEEIQFGSKEKLTFIFIIITLVTFICILKTNPPNRNAILYKNTIYYPKNKDPIMTDLKKTQNFELPEE
jgi:hypothetical protein